jgi:hypothetical protein
MLDVAHQDEIVHQCSNAAGRFYEAGSQLLGATQDAAVAAMELRRPSVQYRPRLFIDGSQWCVLYGANLQDGVAGFGATPAEAMADFDAAWSRPLTSSEREQRESERQRRESEEA